MNRFKRFAAVLLALSLVASLAACHPKNEIAMTVGDVQITSALYMCALIQADSEGRNKVDELAGDDVTDINYYKQKIDNTDFSVWVKNRAEEVCKEYAAYEIKFEEAGLTLDGDTLSTIDTYVNYYWTSAGYSQIYEENGVNLDTYKKFFTYSYKSQEYFTSIYGKEGTNPVSDADLTTALSENYVLADLLTGSYTDSSTGTSMTDEEKAALKTRFEGYVARLQGGESFAAIYNEYNGTTEEDSDATSDTGESAPQDKYAQALGGEKTASPSDNYDTVKAMANAEAKLIEADTGLTIAVRKDIMADPYYLESMNPQLLVLLKQDEFQAGIDEFIKTLTVDKNNYAVDRFKVKNIVYPSANSAAA